MTGSQVGNTNVGGKQGWWGGLRCPSLRKYHLKNTESHSKNPKAHIKKEAMQFKHVAMKLEADYEQEQQNLIKARDANPSAVTLTKEARLLRSTWFGATEKVKSAYIDSKLQDKKEFRKLMTGLLVLKRGFQNELDDFNAIDLDNTPSGDYQQLAHNAKIQHKRMHDLKEEILHMLVMYGKFHNHDSTYIKKYYISLAQEINIQSGFA